MLSTFTAAATGFVYSYHKSGRELPERFPMVDVLLLGVATHKLSRIIARDKVAAAVRAPFTEFERPAGSAEVEERPRGTGLQRTVGELITCPYCLAVWIASALTAGLVCVPRVTRLICSVFSAVTLSDFLQQAYVRIKDSE